IARAPCPSRRGPNARGVSAGGVRRSTGKMKIVSSVRVVRKFRLRTRLVLLQFVEEFLEVGSVAERVEVLVVFELPDGGSRPKVSSLTSALQQGECLSGRFVRQAL